MTRQDKTRQDKTRQLVGNYFDKYNNKNFIVKKIMSGFFSSLKCILQNLKVKNILEAGCGEGYISDYIHKHIYNSTVDIDSFDVTEDIIENAKLNFNDINFFVDSVYEMNNTKEKYDIVLAIEVLEHLTDPDIAIKKLLDKTNKYVLVSVPREPIWCMLNLCRGKYIKDFGNTPGHIQRWGKLKFIKFCKKYGEIVEVQSPLPWTMILLKKTM